MSERILTLFGEEFAPEQPKTPAKSRAKKKQEDESLAEEKIEDAQEAPAQNVAEQREAIEPVVKEVEAVVPQQPEAVIAEEKSIDAAEIIPAEEEEIAIIEQIAHAVVEPPEPERIAEDEKFLLPDDWKGDKNYYAIGEVAELFKVKTSHIRFWTNEFKLKVRTTRKGDRMYTPDQVRELKAIHHLVKERGFTLAGAKAKMKTQNKKDVETVDLKDSLKQLRAKLVIMRDQLG